MHLVTHVIYRANFGVRSTLTKSKKTTAKNCKRKNK